MLSTGNDPGQTLLLIGSPVAHSISPYLHNTAAKVLGLSCVYRAIDTPPQRLATVISEIRAERLLGANVTIPHKEAVMPLLDQLTETADVVGAVNTLFWKDDVLVGDNTDVEGFLAPLSNIDIARQKVLVLGAGGAARAVIYALRKASSIRLAARRPEQARSLLDGMGISGEVVSLDGAHDFVADATLIVNATPLGGPGLEDRSPLDWPSSVERKVLAYDLVYKPSPTRFLRQASEAGAQTIDGRIMLREQASMSFQRWTGHRFPAEVKIPSEQ
jgi:shikimate dehydrogenase